MPDYGFDVSLVTDQVGGVLRTARNAKITVTDPVSGATVAGLKQSGQPVPWAISDGKGRAKFTSTQGSVVITSPNGLARLVFSPDYLSEYLGVKDAASASATAAQTAATNAATSATAAASSAANASTVATSTATTVATSVATQVAADVVRGDSHVLLDTDGVPYFDTTVAGTQVLSLDTDGVPYFI